MFVSRSPCHDLIDKQIDVCSLVQPNATRSKNAAKTVRKTIFLLTLPSSRMMDSGLSAIIFPTVDITAQCQKPWQNPCRRSCLGKGVLVYTAERLPINSLCSVTW